MIERIAPDPVAAKVAAHLAAAGIAFEYAGNGRLHVPLPNDFGTFEIGACDDAAQTICGLVGEPWHTHGDLFGATGLEEQCAGLGRFVVAVFAGEYLLIEETSPGQAPQKFVEDDLYAYLRSLPEGATYRIFNRPAR